MNTNDTIRALKDEDFRATLPADQRPENPAGVVELDDAQLEAVAGGAMALPRSPRILWTAYCCA